MTSETDWQKKICDSIEADGGFSRKWASEMSVGNPDLVVAIRPIGGMLIEVKYERKWFTNTSRTLEVSTLQKRSIMKYNAAGGVAYVMTVADTAVRETYVLLHEMGIVSTLQPVVLSRSRVVERGLKWKAGKGLLDYIIAEHNYIVNRNGE